MTKDKKEKLMEVRIYTSAVIIGGALLLAYYLFYKYSGPFLDNVLRIAILLFLALAGSLAIGMMIIEKLQKKDKKDEGIEEKRGERLDQEFRKLMKKYGGDPEDFSWSYGPRIIKFRILDEMHDRLKRVEKQLDKIEKQIEAR